MVTANLNLKTSTVGVTTDSVAAQNDQDNIQLIDLHDHTSGKGVKVPTGGLNINADLTFNSNQATDLEAVEFTSQTGAISQANTIYVKDGELYYIDAALNSIQLTLNGALNLNTATSSQVFLDGGNARGANLRAGTNDAYSMILETNNTDRFQINQDGLATFINDFAAQRGAAVSSTGTLNDVSTSAKSYFQFTGAGSVTVTGFANGADGKIVILTNKTGVSLLINNDDAGSVAANRILTGTGAPLTIRNNASTMMVYDSANSRWNVIGGTGSSSSGGLYTAIDFEDTTTGGISTFADGAVSIPVDGTGGSPNSTFVNSSSSPLRGTYSGLFTKSGTANRQGEGFSLPITLASADTAKTIQVAFDWSASSTMPSSSMVFYVYDVTNAAIITPSVTTLPTGDASQYTVAFNATTSTSYRLIWMISSTTTTDFTVKIDQIQVSPVVRPIVAGIGDWINYTPTVSAGFGTVTNNVAKYRRVGDSIEVQGSFTAGTTAASIGSISLPTPYTLDSTKLTINNTTAASGNVVGTYNPNASVANNIGNIVTAPNTSTTLVYCGQNYLTAGDHNIAASSVSATVLGTGAIMSYSFKVPVAQFSSNITLATTAPAIEYASNSSSTDADDTSSFVAGAGGSAGVLRTTTLTAVRKKRIQFAQPIQSTDRVQIEFYDPTVGLWTSNFGVRLNGVDYVTLLAGSFTATPTNNSAGMSLIQVSSTQLDVVFNRVASMATANASGVLTAYDWSDADFPVGIKWRVAKISSIGGAELAPATEISQGTVAYSQWTSYTPTFSAGFGICTSFGSASGSPTGRYRREGDSMRVKISARSGTPAASIASCTLPSTYTIDPSKLVVNSTTAAAGDSIGHYFRNASGANVSGYVIAASSTSTSLVYFGAPQVLAVSHLTPQNGNTVIGNTEDFTLEFLIPISGWA